MTRTFVNRLALALGSCAVLCSTPLAAAQNMPNLAWFGKSLTQVRAETPDLSWTEDRSSSFMDVLRMTATGVLTLDNKPFDLRVTEALGHVVSQDVMRNEPVSNAAECQTAGVAFLLALEPQFGPFYWDVRATRGEQLAQTRAGSVYMFVGWREPATPVAADQFTSPDTTGFAIRARGTAQSADGHLNLLLKTDYHQGCQLRLEIERAYNE